MIQPRVLPLSLLACTLALLATMGVTDAELLTDWIAVGELTLDGRIVASPGVLLAALHASQEEKGLICPAVQGAEARWAAGVPICAAPDLISLLNHLKGVQRLPEPQPGEVAEPGRGPDLKQVKGQESAKRALEIAAAGGHNLLMIGPPGAGKSLLAACLPGILPPLTSAEALEVSMVASVAGELEGGPELPRRSHLALGVAQRRGVAAEAHHDRRAGHPGVVQLVGTGGGDRRVGECDVVDDDHGPVDARLGHRRGTADHDPPSECRGSAKDG